MTGVITTGAWIGMAAATLTAVLRALPPMNRWTRAGKKPWACDLCMSLWCSVVAACGCLGELALLDLGRAVGAAVAVSMAALSGIGKPQDPPLEALTKQMPYEDEKTPLEVPTQKGDIGDGPS